MIFNWFLKYVLIGYEDVFWPKKNGDKSCQSNLDKRASDFGSFFHSYLITTVFSILYVKMIIMCFLLFSIYSVLNVTFVLRRTGAAIICNAITVNTISAGCV